MSDSIFNPLQLAVTYHQTGQLQQAKTLYQQILTEDPEHGNALHLLGLILYEEQDYSQAYTLITKAIQLSPDIADYYNNLGLVLLAQQQPTEAIAALQKAISLQPDHARAYHNLGDAFYALWDREQALRCYRKSLELNPNLFKVHNNLGNTLADQGYLEEAIVHYRKALQLKPDFVEAYDNLGIALSQQKQFKQALEVFEQALALRPDHVDLYNSTAIVLKELGQYDKAQEYLQKALALDPQYPLAYNTLGDIAREQGQFAEAIFHYRRALEHCPVSQSPIIYNKLGVTFDAQGNPFEAIPCFEQALSIDPQHPLASNNLGMALQGVGQIEKSLFHLQKATEFNSRMATAYSNYLLISHYLPNPDPTTLRLEHEQFTTKYFPFAPQSSFPNTPNPHRKLKIGYVSGDFARHSVTYFIEPILNHHSPQFEVFCYYNNSKADEVTLRLRDRDPTHFFQSYYLSDEKFVELIQQHGIDILVDLSGHTAQNRLLFFARKPAPIQITYLGYPDTTGLTAIDYRLTDYYTDPEGSEQWSTEQMLRFSRSYFCYRPYDQAPPVNPLPALQNGYITFGSFNNYAKLNPDILKLWAEILHSIPTAKLLLKTKNLNDPKLQQQLTAQFEEWGIAADRLILNNFIRATEDHLTHYHQVDIALDTYPYNGATTTCEALWMGVPVITLVGQTHISRMGLSVLSAANLPDWITYSPEDYVQLAQQRAGDLDKLQKLRSHLRQYLQNSPLLDACDCTHQLENLYRQAWQQWCATQQAATPLFPASEFSLPGHAGLQLAVQHYQHEEHEKAKQLCQQILLNSPEHPEALHLLGLINYQLQNYAEGIDLLKKVAERHPKIPYIHTNLGIMLGQRGQSKEARACYQKAISTNSRDSLAHNNLGVELYHQGKINEGIRHLRQALILNSQDVMAHSNLLMMLNYVLEDPRLLFLEHQRFNTQQAATLNPRSSLTFTHAKRPDRPLKIGYVSSDLRFHVVAHFMEAILAHHDHEQFKITCYFNQTVEDEISLRFKSYVDQWVNCAFLSDKDLAQQIQVDEIDILVDLNGHSAKNRLLIFAQQSAPLQITYLGYPNTIGLNTIQYRMTDAHIDPPGSTEQWNVETLVRMPHSYFCYHPLLHEAAATVTVPPCQNKGYVTFGSLNNYAKLTPKMLALWAKILNRVPNSKLLIKTSKVDEDAVQTELTRYFKTYQITPERLIFQGQTLATADYLTIYQEIDITLDTYPYNGATTTCETLFMGVPVVNLAGNTHASRMGLSILSTVGLHEWVATSPDAYIDIAVKLAHDEGKLQQWRTTLRQQLQNSPLMDGITFTRNLEAQYRQIWATYCQQ